MIYSFFYDPDEDLAHIKEVMAILAKNNLYIRSEKCQWMRKSLDYLGFTIQGSTNLASGGVKPSIKILKRLLIGKYPRTYDTCNLFLASQTFIEDLLGTILQLRLRCINYQKNEVRSFGLASVTMHSGL